MPFIGERSAQAQGTCLALVPSRSTRSLVFVSLLVGVALLAGTHVAHAGLCITPAGAGAWRNSDAASRGITILDFRMECRDASVTKCDGDICSTTFAVAPHYFVTLFGSCSPSACPWGEVEGQALGGSLSGWYYFQYDQGFAKRAVYVRTYSALPGRLRLWIHTDFVDAGRADYTTDEWFVPR